MENEIYDVSKAMYRDITIQRLESEHLSHVQRQVPSRTALTPEEKMKIEQEFDTLSSVADLEVTRAASDTEQKRHGIRKLLMEMQTMHQLSMRKEEEKWRRLYDSLLNKFAVVTKHNENLVTRLLMESDLRKKLENEQRMLEELLNRMEKANQCPIM